MLRERFQTIVDALLAASLAVYGERLLSAAVFGSVARGTMRPDSDIDLLLVVADLPNGRMPRVREFDAVEHRLEPLLAAAARDGVHTTVSPVFKTPQELDYGSLLFLDMTEEVLILHDPAGILRGYLDKLTTAGIPTAIHYPMPMNQQPAYAHLCCPDCTPRAQAIAQRVMSLPMHADLTQAEQQRIVGALRARTPQA